MLERALVKEFQNCSSLPYAGFVWAPTAMGPRALHTLHTPFLRHCRNYKLITLACRLLM